MLWNNLIILGFGASVFFPLEQQPGGSGETQAGIGVEKSGGNWGKKAKFRRDRAGGVGGWKGMGKVWKRLEKGWEKVEKGMEKGQKGLEKAGKGPWKTVGKIPGKRQEKAGKEVEIAMEKGWENPWKRAGKRLE